VFDQVEACVVVGDQGEGGAVEVGGADAVGVALDGAGDGAPVRVLGGLMVGERLVYGGVPPPGGGQDLSLVRSGGEVVAAFVVPVDLFDGHQGLLSVRGSAGCA